MSIALGIVAAAVTTLTVVGVLALFVWGAVKDGEEESASQARMAASRLQRARPRRRSSASAAADRGARPSARRSRR